MPVYIRIDLGQLRSCAASYCEPHVTLIVRVLYLSILLKLRHIYSLGAMYRLHSASSTLINLQR